MTGEEKPGLGSTVIGYEPEMAEIISTIEQSGTGTPEHIAIVAEPMTGRSTMVAEIRRLYGDRVYYLPLEFVVRESDLPDFASLPYDIILIDNCQFLSTRRIGGFSVIDSFLRTQISSKKLFITTWNTFSWQYLSSVIHLDSYFPKRIILGRIDTPVLRDVIQARYKPGEITFLDEGIAERSMFFSIVHPKVHLPFMDDEITVPWIKLNFTVMIRKLPHHKRVIISVEDIIFEKINRIAGGNLGVAILLWDESLRDNTISFGNINEKSYSMSLNTNESFILATIVSMETLHENDLAAIAGSEMDFKKIVYRLVQQGLVRDSNGYYSIEPFALVPVIDYLKKTRRLW